MCTCDIVCIYIYVKASTYTLRYYMYIQATQKNTGSAVSLKGRNTLVSSVQSVDLLYCEGRKSYFKFFGVKFMPLHPPLQLLHSVILLNVYVYVYMYVCACVYVGLHDVERNASVYVYMCVGCGEKTSLQVIIRLTKSHSQTQREVVWE